MSGHEGSLLFLRVSAEPDPGVFARVLERFQNMNLLPRRVVAEWATTGLVHVEVQVVGISETALDLIAAKISQVPSILNAYWHH